MAVRIDTQVLSNSATAGDDTTKTSPAQMHNFVRRLPPINMQLKCNLKCNFTWTCNHFITFLVIKLNGAKFLNKCERILTFYVYIETSSRTVFSVSSFYTHLYFWYKFRNTFWVASCCVPHPTASLGLIPISPPRAKCTPSLPTALLAHLAWRISTFKLGNLSSVHFTAVLNISFYTYGSS